MSFNFKAWLLGVLKPFVNRELTYIANDLTENAAKYEQDGAAAGMSAVDYVEQLVLGLVAKNPFLSAFGLSSSLQPIVSSFLAGLVAQGTSDVPSLIKEVAAFIVKEEQYI